MHLLSCHSSKSSALRHASPNWSAPPRLAAALAAALWLASSAAAEGPADADLHFRLEREVSTNGEYISQMAVDREGRLIVLVSGNPTLPALGLARYSSDGTRDAAFNPLITGSRLSSALPLGNGKILLTGVFRMTQDGITRTNAARLNSDGSLDAAFHLGSEWQSIGSFTELPDGRLFILSPRTIAGGVRIPGPHRLSSEGELDVSFAPASQWAELAVESLLLRPDGSAYLIGMLRPRIGNELVRIARMLPDGSVDDSFHYSGRWVYGAVLGSDGTLYVVVSSDKSTTQTTVLDVLRLRPDGTQDPAFRAEVSGRNLVSGGGIMNPPSLRGMQVQLDGRLVLAGKFDRVNGTSRRNVVRLKPDGAVDASFDPGSGPLIARDSSNFGYPVHLMVLSREGRIYLAGELDRYQGMTFPQAVRLRGDPVPRLQIGRSDGTVEASWIGHPGESVEVEASTDLSDWSAYHSFNHTGGVARLPRPTGERIFLRARGR